MITYYENEIAKIEGWLRYMRARIATDSPNDAVINGRQCEKGEETIAWMRAKIGQLRGAQ